MPLDLPYLLPQLTYHHPTFQAIQRLKEMRLGYSTKSNYDASQQDLILSIQSFRGSLAARCPGRSSDQSQILKVDYLHSNLLEAACKASLTFLIVRLPSCVSLAQASLVTGYDLAQLVIFHHYFLTVCLILLYRVS